MTATLSFVLALLTNYASTPQKAALGVFYPPHNSHVIAEHTNIVRRYAAVMVRGGVMEGSLIHEPILVEHFRSVGKLSTF